MLLEPTRVIPGVPLPVAGNEVVDAGEVRARAWRGTAEDWSWELAEPVGLTQFVARRLAKTRCLQPLWQSGLAREVVLAHVAIYAALAGATYGRAAGLPRVDPRGTLVHETDPQTGARITVACTSRRPACLSATVELDGLGVLSWEECAIGPRLALCALSVPVEIDVTFAGARGGPLGGYVATLSGRLETTLRPRIGRWLVRTRGEVTAHDAWSHTAQVRLSDQGRLSGRAVAASGALASLGGSLECPWVQTDPARRATGVTSRAA